jgi:hypothetical protein
LIENFTLGSGKVAAREEDVKTKRLIEDVFAHALSAFRPPLTPIETAVSTSEKPPRGDAMWMKPSIPKWRALLAFYSLSMVEESKRHTINDFIITPFGRHIRYSDQLELRSLVLFCKVLGQPLVLLNIPHCTTDVVSSLEKLVDNMTSDKAVDTSY